MGCLIKLLLYGYIDGKRVGIDGMKLKAYTGWDMLDGEDLDRRLARAHDRLEEWMSKIAIYDALDEADDCLGHLPGQAGEPDMMEAIGALQGRIEALEAAKKRLAESEATRLPLSDPEARSMRAPHGGKPPSYNLQASVDGKHQMLAGVNMTNAPTDFEQLPEMHWRLIEQLGWDPEELLADRLRRLRRH